MANEIKQAAVITKQDISDLVVSDDQSQDASPVAISEQDISDLTPGGGLEDRDLTPAATISQQDIADITPEAISQGDELKDVLYKNPTPRQGFSPDRSFVEQFFDGLDYLGNAVRSGIVGTLEADSLDDPFRYIGQALTMRRKTDARALLDAISVKLGGKAGGFSQKKGEFDAGDIADAAAEFGTYLLTDPLFLLSAGLSAGAKGAAAAFKAGKQLSAWQRTATATTSTGLKLVEAMSAQDIAKAGAAFAPFKEAADKYTKLAPVIHSGLGAMYGFGTADEESGFFDFVGRGLAGAVVGRYLPAGLKLTGQVGRKTGDAIANRYYELAYPSVFMDAEELGNAIGARVANLSRAPKEVREKIAKSNNIEWQSFLDGTVDEKAQWVRGAGLKESEVADLLAGDSESRKQLVEVLKSIPRMSASVASQEARMGLNQVNPYGTMLKQGFHAAMDGLDASEVKRVKNGLRESTGRFLQERNVIFAEVSRQKFGGKASANNISDYRRTYSEWKAGKAPKEQGELAEQVLTEWRAAEEAADRLVQEVHVPAMLSGKADMRWFEDGYQAYMPNEIKAFREMEKLNDRFWKTYLAHKAPKLEGKAGVDYFSPVGIRWKVDEGVKAGDIAEIENILGKLAKIREPEFATKIAVAKKEQLLENVIGDADRSYAIFADREALKFLERKQAQGLRMMSEVARLDPKGNISGVSFKSIADGMKHFDKVHQFMKANMLGASLVWHKNNHFENTVKAYLDAGFPTAVRTALFGANKELQRDIWRLANNKFTQKQFLFKHPDVQEALDMGILNNRLFRTMASDDTPEIARSLLSPKAYDQYVDKLKNQGPVGKSMDKVVDVLDRTSFRFGEMIEGTSRMTTYLHHKKALMESPMVAILKKQGVADVDKRIREIAAELTKKTFFDYGDISLFERNVMKRLFPFWSFYSKNFPYWMDSIFDIRKLGKISNAAHVKDLIGRAPTDRERRGLTGFAAKGAPMSLGRGTGGRQYADFSSVPLYDALNIINPKQLPRQFVEKFNPILKLVPEMGLNVNTFTGGKFFPSTREGRRKRPSPFFSSGFKYGFLPESIVKIDKKHGQTYLQPNLGGDIVAVVDRLASLGLPTSSINKLMQAAYQTGHGSRSKTEVYTNLLTPLRISTISPRAAAAAKKRKRAEGKL